MLILREYQCRYSKDLIIIQQVINGAFKCPLTTINVHNVIRNLKRCVLFMNVARSVLRAEERLKNCFYLRPRCTAIWRAVASLRRVRCGRSRNERYPGNVNSAVISVASNKRVIAGVAYLSI